MIVDYASVGETRDDPAWEPLVVTARLSEPIVHYEDGLHLDGPLQWAAWRAYALEHGDPIGPPPSDWIPDYEIPVARWVGPPAHEGADPRLATADGKLWGWCCSDAIGEWVATSKAEVRKRPAVAEMLRYSKDRTYNSSLGAHKAKDLTFPTVQAHELTWHVLGAADSMRRLLLRIHSLGKLRGHGHGRVMEWRIEEGCDRDGWKQRRMPAPKDHSGPTSMETIRAPYWHRPRQAPCIPREAQWTT